MLSAKSSTKVINQMGISCIRGSQGERSDLPSQDLVGEELIDELHVVGLEVLGLGDFIRLGVQVVRVEGLDGIQHLLILLVHHPAVSSLLVPGVEAVVADHGKSLIGNGALLLDDVVEVLVVAPADHDVVETAARCVDTVLGAVDGVLAVGVVLESAGVDDAVVELAADDESVTDNIPLTLCLEEEEELAQVVDKTDQLEPAGLAIAADSLSGLKQVLDLRQ